MEDSDDHEPAAADEIRAMAHPDAAMSPANKNGGPVSNPFGLRIPDSFRYMGHPALRDPWRGSKTSRASAF